VGKVLITLNAYKTVKGQAFSVKLYDFILNPVGLATATKLIRNIYLLLIN